MKSFPLSLGIAAALLTACGGAAEEAASTNAPAANEAVEASYTVDPAQSQVHWAATMVGVKTHRGVLPVNGQLKLKGDAVTGGEFTVDLKMDATALVDSNYAPDGSKQGTKANLIGHLMSPDFFAADSFPTSTFKITSVSGNTATGDLTVRGKTHPETVTDIVVTNEGGMVKATGKLVFDRQKYGVAWSSGMKDMVLSDNVELTVALTGKPM